MSVVLSENIQTNAVPATDELTELLAGLGFDAEVVELELAIDRFDQWTNPTDAALVNTSGVWPAADIEFERVA